MRRHDVSGVPLQGAYVAKRCPVRAQNDVLRPAEPAAASAFVEHLWAEGSLLEDDVQAELAGLHPGLVATVEEDRSELEERTLEAMRSGAPLIVGGRLPRDELGRRVGEPDLLVRAQGGGYRAVEVKNHLTTNPAGPNSKKDPVTVSSLERPWFEDRRILTGVVGRKKRDDLVQLAHYQRILETAGFAADDGRRWAGVIGAERQIVWWDLDEKLWLTPSSVPGKKKRRSTMEIYDHEFDFRLDVIAVALAHREDPDRAPLVVPVKIAECDRCPWWPACATELQEGHGDVSLVSPGVGWLQWKDHQARGVRDRNDLASLDVRTARLVTGAKVDVQRYEAESRALAPSTPIADLPGITEADVAALVSEGVTAVGGLRSLCPRTARYFTAPNSGRLAGQIDLARAALGPSGAYRVRGLEEIWVPRAEVEVDIDMENNLEGRVYLWGVLHHDRRTAEEGTYRPFVEWSKALDEGQESALFAEFWRWLESLRRSSAERGLTLRAYCYTDAEKTQMLRLAERAGLLADVTAFLEGSEWTDMHRVVEEQLLTGSGLGLKDVAPLSGFTWEIEDPGGGESMLRYEVATDPLVSATERRGAQDWLLAYNRGDVEATRALRDWLEDDGTAIPPIETLEPWTDRGLTGH